MLSGTVFYQLYTLSDELVSLNWQNSILVTALRHFFRCCTGQYLEPLIRVPDSLTAETEFLSQGGKQRLPVRNPPPLATPKALNQSCSLDFIHDALI